MTEPVLRIKELVTDLHVNNRVVNAVKGVSLSIEAGQTYCLVGESGSGKSVLALSVMGLLPSGITRHPNGAVYLSGQSLLDGTEADWLSCRGDRIAMIFQEPMTALNPVLTVGEQLMEVLAQHRTDLSEEQAKARCIDYLQQVQLDNPEARFNTFAHQLSGGQRQRVMIAMALLCEPELLIADEPTTALDVTVQAEILRLINKLQSERGMACLFITHDFGIVAQMADRVGVMRRGELVEQNIRKAILNNPQHAYSQALIAAVPENLPKFNEELERSHDVGTQLLQVTDLNIWYPVRSGFFRRITSHIKACQDISLDISSKEIVAVVGESGCGKSSLGRGILQLERIRSGAVILQGKQLVDLSARELRPLRARMQGVFQDPMSALNPRLLVETMLTEPMAVHGIGENHEARIERAADVLAKVQMQREHLWRYPHEFSGGQRQRIGIARALVLSPKILICDEITSALDVSVQAEILTLLKAIRDEAGMGMLFITHNMGVVEYLSDRTMVMKKGVVVESGPTDQIVNHPEASYTQTLMDAVPRLS